ncbi:MAG: hypothetical protein AABZ55_10210 [Bdellovibrionota bacterium]
MTLLKTIGLALLFSTFFGCNGDKELSNWVDATTLKRDTARIVSNQTPYREEQYIGLQNYFAELAKMAANLESNADLTEGLNTEIAKVNLAEVCGKILITKNESQTIIHHCTRNRFFLCSEEVRAYATIIQAFRSRLNTEQQKRFDETSDCRAALD